MMTDDRTVDGVVFRIVNVSVYEIPVPHWVAENGKPVTVIPPQVDGLKDEWCVYAPLCGSTSGFQRCTGNEAEERAFSVAALFAKQD